ncbi:unnamed protein product [Closterium sp. NIES-53]
MLALCREHRLEHRTKHIALRYFLARELQQRGQLRLAYVASQANTADIFTTALPPGDHQRFCTLLACFPLLDWPCDLLFSPTLPMGVLQRFDFTYSSPQATPLSTRHSLSALPSDESVEPSGPYPELVGCLMYLMTCTRPDLAYPLSILARYVAPGRHRPEHMAAAKRVLRYLCSTSGMGLVLGGRRPVVLTGHADASWADDQATQRSSQGYTFSLGSGSVSWRTTRSSSVLSSSCEAEIYAGAMAAQELRWLTYLLTDLGEQPRSPPVLYVDNKAMLALCREHRLEHRTKHIALRYFLARELQQRGQLRLAYVASEANTADIFTKALAPGDHQRFCTLLACFVLLDWSCDPLFSPTLPMGVFPTCTQYSASSFIPDSSHHRLGHPFLPHLRGMHFRLLVSGLPRSLPPLPPSPAPPCLPCVEGRQRAAPHSSSFPPTTAPLQTLHMDVWGPARVSGQGRERYFLLVVDDYTRYTTVFPLRSKGPSDRGGEFSSDLLREFCRGEGITQSITLPNSPQQNGIAERSIGLVMEVAPQPLARVSLPETSPTLRWTGKVGDASVFRVWGSRAFVCDTSADKLSARAIPCVFLGFVHDAPGWQFYHPTSRRVLPSQDVTFDESVPFYRLFPYRSAPSPPPPLFLAPGPSPVDPLLPQGPAPSGVSQVDPLQGTALVQVAVVSRAAPGAASGGVASGGVELGGAGSEGARSGEGAESGGAEPRGAASSGGPTGASPRLSSQKLHERLVQRAHRRSGAPGAGELGGAGARGAAVTTGAGDPREPRAAGALGAGAGVAGVGGRGAGGAGAAGAGAIDPGAGGAGGPVRPRLYFVPLLQQSQPPLQPASPLPVPSPYTEQSGGLTERREPASRPVSPVRTARRAPRSRPPPFPGTHTMSLRPSSFPLRGPLPAPPESSLLEVPDPESDRARAANPSVARLLATAVTDPSFESAAASALVAELLDFAAACRLDYASALVAESVPASPPSVGGECALGTDVLEDRQEDFECLEAAVPCFASMLLAPEGDPDAPHISTPRSYAEAITGTYVDEVPPPGVNIVDGMWIFSVKRPPGSPPAFKARYVAGGFSQRQGVDYF